MESNSNKRIETAFNNEKSMFEQDLSIEVMKEKFPEYIEMMDRFGRLVGKNGKVLDAGCANGRDVEYFNSIGLNAVGIDIASDLVETGKDKGREVARMDVKNLGFEDSSFDGVWCNSVVQFFNPSNGEMQKGLEELCRVLKTGGVLYINFKVGKGETLRENYDPALRQFHLPESAIKQMLEDFPLEVIGSKENPALNTLSLFLEKTG